MILVDCLQGSEEWFTARLGLPTASMFDKILTPTGKLSSQAESYMNLLVAERLAGKPLGWDGNAWTERGKELEPEARDFYEFYAGCEVQEVGLCLRDDGLVGCSPDGLVGEDGGLEIKCPSPQVHVEYMDGGKVPTKYLAQVQGCLYVTGREWWDFVSYHPDLDPVVCRVLPDPKYHKLLDDALETFLEKLTAKLERIRAKT